MPIDLPPPVPPQFSHEPAVLEARYESALTGTIQLQVGNQTVLISGNNYLSEDRIREAARAVDSVSKFILLLNALYAAAGYPLVNVEYAQDRDTLTVYVDVSQGYIERVNAPPLLAPFFDRFENIRDLKNRDFKVMQVLAGIKADRAGVEVSSEYEVNKVQPDQFVLKMDTEPDPEHDGWSVSNVFGNPGNRFLGRYFNFTNLQYNTSGGDILGLKYGTALTGLGDARGGKSYHHGQLSYSIVNPYGLYGASASYTQYELNDRFGFQETERSRTTELAFQGSQFLYATDTTRWLVNEKLEYVDATTEVTDAPTTSTLDDGTEFPVEGQRTQEERYAAFRLGSSFRHSRLLFGYPLSVTLKGGYKRGFAGEIDNLVNSNRQSDFNLFAGEFELSYRLFWGVTPKLLLKGQRSLDRELPQQQQWVLGGPGQLSAFLPGILVGDSGAYGRFDLQLPRLDLGSGSWRLTLFVEGGNAVYEDRRGSDAAVRAVADAGIKLELGITDWLDITAYSAESLGDRNFEIFPGPDYVDDNEADVFFNINVKL